MTSRTLPQRDLQDVIDRSSFPAELEAARLLITGGGGFVGSWLVESLIHANDFGGANLSAAIVSRNPADLLRRLPHLNHVQGFEVIPGDVTTLDLNDEPFDFVIHAASPVSAEMNISSPEQTFASILSGTEGVLDQAARSKVARVLFISSGAIYGTQRSEVAGLSEAHKVDGASLTGYAKGKWLSEQACLRFTEESGIETVIARGFTFMGPRMEMDAFAIGNFMRDCIKEGHVVVKGDGRTVRSYMYAADLAIWLWSILMHGQPGRTYNVGSETPVSIISAAEVVANEYARMTGKEPRISIHAEEVASFAGNRYVPNCERARSEMSLKTWTALDEAVRRTFEWLLVT